MKASLPIYTRFSTTVDNDEAEIWTVLDWRKELTVVDRPYIPEEAP